MDFSHLQIADAHILSAPLVGVADDALSEDELELVLQAPSESRRQELRAGRALARKAIQILHPHASFSLLSDAKGRPQLLGAMAHVSLAHTEQQVVAAASLKPVGIDMEPLGRRKQVSRVVTTLRERGRARGLLWSNEALEQLVALLRADKEGEAEPGRQSPFESDALLLWTAWEAMGKLEGIGVLSSVMRREIVLRGVSALEPANRGGHDSSRALQFLCGDCGAYRLWWWVDREHLCCLATE